MGSPEAGTRRVGIKICGIRDTATLDVAVEAGADWIGLVFATGSPRRVTTQDAARLAAEAAGRVAVVGLFVDPTDEEVARTLETVGLDILQLYTSPERALALRQRFGRPVWLAQAMRRAEDLPLQTALDGLLIEAPPAPDDATPGGNGRHFDWRLVREWQAPVPWLLAGGLRPGNVSVAIEASGAPAVDVSSGVEVMRGRKDAGLIRSFVEAARGNS